jgi:hypothetical protein
MKMATWNLMRPTERTASRNEIFLEELRNSNADILVLTETNSMINPGDGYFSRSTRELPAEFEGFKYSKGENRTSIFSKFPFGRDFKTYDEYTSVCSEILTPYGSLIFYATIIGVTGGKDKRFIQDFENQKSDIDKLAGDICIAGDFNISFSGYPYPSRETINQANIYFETQGMEILTKELADCPDHISISKNYLKNCEIKIEKGKLDKKISDHILVTVNLNF